MELPTILITLGTMASRYGDKLSYRVYHYNDKGEKTNTQKTKASEIRIQFTSFGFVLTTDMNQVQIEHSEDNYPVFFDTDASEMSFDKGKSYFKIQDFFNDEMKEITATKVFRTPGKRALSPTSRKLVKMWLD